MRKKTHKEYVDELAIKNPTVKVVDEYIDSDTSITHYCLSHDIYWQAKPSNILLGKGCKECAKEKTRRKRVKSHEQYVEELAIKNPTIKVIDKYVTNRTPIMHYCFLHDIYWKITPCNALKGKGCRECMGEKISNRLSKSHEMYIEDLAIVNPSIEVVDKYINGNTPIVHHCLLHDVYWKIAPHNALNGQGCVECMRGKYRKSMAKSHEQYVENVSMINSDIEVVDEYINAKTPILHRCKIDGREWLAAPTNILNGQCCPQCKESSGERCVRLWLDNNKFTYIREKTFNDCKDKQPLPFDFYIPDYNVAIEYQGQQHYYAVDIFGGEKAFELQKKHDEIKKEYCENNNIRLLCIPYYSNAEEELNNFLFI